jgi:hypothetical protein
MTLWQATTTVNDYKETGVWLGWKGDEGNGEAID